MIRTILSISCGIILGVLALSVAAAPEKKERHKPITRLAFLVGANNGGQGRVRLLYSHTDTRAVSKVFQELGGITPGNTHLLLDPSRGDFLRKSTALASTIAALRGSGRQVQVIFYYSGHSDETGLLLGGERLTYKELRKNLKDLKGDVTIAILDSCSSGAVTRAKGGRFVPSFLNSQQDVTRGEVFLTSSSASEAAQESDTIKGSYFTHYMISGLRGAADTSNDQRVTIGEAYQYAFARTLKRTESSQSGPQHPNYAFRLVGSGDLVITELKKTRSKLIIPKAVIGRILVRDSQGNLVSEVEKFGKMPLHIALAPGVYQVTFITGKLVRRGQVVLGRVRVTMFDVNRLRRASTEGARGKGPQDSPVTLVPASLSLFPFMSVNRGFGGRVVNLFSLNLLYEQAWSLSGLEISGLGVLRSGSVRGIQIAGLFNYNEGPTTGLQIGGLLSGTDRDYKGIQIGGVGSVAMGNTTGLQIGGVLDFTLGHLRGAQIAGLANVAGNGGKGLQIGGVTNISGANFTGLQIAGVANITAGDMKGLQISGVFNSARDVTGLQLGVVNVARNVRGMQLGVVNVADRSSWSLGLVNIIKNGRYLLGVNTDTARGLNLEFKHGGDYWHTIYSVGTYLNDSTYRGTLRTGAGFGAHIPLNPQLSVDLDALTYQKDVTRSETPSGTDQYPVNTLRLQFFYTVSPVMRVTFSAGLTTYIYDGNLDQPESYIRGWLLRDGKNDRDRVEVYLAPELSLGLAYRF